MKQIILASTSPRRIALMQSLGIPFTVEASEYEENMTLPLPAKELALTLSLGKAMAVANKKENALVIGADTFIVFQNMFLGKPHSPEDAFRMLRLLSGNKHAIITGYSVVDADTKQLWQDYAETVVTFKQLSDAQINAYIQTGEPLDKAGAYAIQGKGAELVQEVEGDYDSAIGLPLIKLKATLESIGVLFDK